MGGSSTNFPFDEVVSGGIGRDAIPALTDPRFVNLNSGEASYLFDNDLVLGVVVNGEAKAYPHNIGWWNEIVNDVVGGQPVVVSFCPLTGTGLVFDGRGDDGRRITCGVSGQLFNNNLIMFDRRDNDTLYPQMIFRGITGQRTGQDLSLMPVIETTWRYWKELYPNTTVVSDNTGTPRDYRSYPYIFGSGDYRFSEFPPLFSTSPRRDQNPTAQLFDFKDLTLGVRFDELAKAYPFQSMGEEAVINDIVDNTPIVVVWYGAEQMAIPYFREMESGSGPLTFEKVASSDSRFPFYMKDNETGTTWNLKGEAIEGALKGNRLQQVPAHNAFWFAWATFWQNTELF